MTTDHASKAKELMREAQQMGSKVSGGGCCGQGGRAKIAEACELYTKAANSYKMAKDWSAAGRAFAEAATLELDNKRLQEASNHFAEASKCYKKVSTTECVKCLEKAIEIYTDRGKQRIAAKHHQALAELYEEEGSHKDLSKSIHHNSLAAELFAGEESVSASNKCRLQVAKHSALVGDYAKSIEIYETVGKTSLESNLLKYTATDMFCRAGLCRLYLIVSKNAEIAASKMAEIVAEYDEASPSFSESRDRELLVKLAAACSESDMDAFNEAIRSHESVNRLDPWHNEIIRCIRKFSQGDPDLR